MASDERRGDDERERRDVADDEVDGDACEPACLVVDLPVEVAVELANGRHRGGVIVRDAVALHDAGVARAGQQAVRAADRPGEEAGIGGSAKHDVDAAAGEQRVDDFDFARRVAEAVTRDEEGNGQYSHGIIRQRTRFE